MYNVTKDINSESTSTNFLDVGIHEDVELTGVEYKESAEGNKFMVFHLEKDGKKLDHTEWEPRDVDATKLENKRLNQMKRVKHIVTKFISEDAYVFKASDFKSFCEETIRLLGESYKGKKVRAKVIYAFNNYTSLPNYVPFMESMSIPKEQSKLSILSIDKMTRDRADVETSTPTNPFDVETQTVETEPATVNPAATDDLPF